LIPSIVKVVPQAISELVDIVDSAIEIIPDPITEPLDVPDPTSCPASNIIWNILHTLDILIPATLHAVRDILHTLCLTASPPCGIVWEVLYIIDSIVETLLNPIFVATDAVFKAVFVLFITFVCNNVLDTRFATISQEGSILTDSLALVHQKCTTSKPCSPSHRHTAIVMIRLLLSVLIPIMAVLRVASLLIIAASFTTARVFEGTLSSLLVFKRITAGLSVPDCAPRVGNWRGWLIVPVAALLAVSVTLALALILTLALALMSEFVDEVV